MHTNTRTYSDIKFVHISTQTHSFTHTHIHIHTHKSRWMNGNTAAFGDNGSGMMWCGVCHHTHSQWSLKKSTQPICVPLMLWGARMRVWVRVCVCMLLSFFSVLHHVFVCMYVNMITPCACVSVCEYDHTMCLCVCVWIWLHHVSPSQHALVEEHPQSCVVSSDHTMQ